MNPLNQYCRIPKLYVRLPSRSKFYAPNQIELTAMQEVAIYPLTAIDQIMLKTPDALLNGEALLKVISHCVPAVSDIKSLVEPDINTLILAIRVASNGPNINIDAACPACKTENQFAVDLNAILETQTYLEDNSQILDFNGELLIHLRPYTFEQRNLHLINELEEIKALRMLESDTDITDTDKINSLAKHVETMADRTFNIVAKSITSIVIVKSGEKVTNHDFILEFLKSLSKSQADTIIDQIKMLNRIGIDTDINCCCDSCGHKWSQNVDFDPTSFFD